MWKIKINMSFECVICSQSLNTEDIFVAIKSCGHMFHSICLNRWLMKSKTCPFCRVLADNNPQFLLRLHPQSVNNLDLSSFYLNPVETTDATNYEIKMKRFQDMLQNLQSVVKQVMQSISEVEAALGNAKNSLINLPSLAHENNIGEPLPVEPTVVLQPLTQESQVEPLASALPARRRSK